MTISPLRLLALLTTLSLLSSCASHQPLPSSVSNVENQEIVWQRDLRYTPADADQPLHGDLVRPVGAGPFPGVLMVHGGGWSSRQRTDMDSSAERFARAGFAVFNISHRFAPEHTFPAQVIDLQQAMRWLHAHAAELNLDRTWIAGYGYSSGAHLIAMLATLSPGDDLYGGDTTRLKAAVLGAAPTDLRRFRGGELIPNFLGTNFEDGFAVYAAASPVTYVSADDPPMFIYHGQRDALVSSDYAEEMAGALAQVGVMHELWLSPLHGHVSLFLMRGGAEDEAIEFLRGQVPLGPPEAASR